MAAAAANTKNAFSQGPLDLEHARFDGGSAPALTCECCSQAIARVYFTANKKVLCASCKEKLTAPPTGSAAGRWLRATGLGLVAAAVGAGIWYAVRALTGYEFGLIAVVIGFLVGAAVRFGAQGRGGLAYQLLAVFLTYTSITSTNVPLILEELKQQSTVDVAAPGGAGTPISDPAGVEPDGAVSAATSPAAAAEAAPAQIGPLAFLAAAAVLLALAYALPFLAGFQNLLGILIIGFGLWQAWRMNARPKLDIAGPFQVSAPAVMPKAA